MDSQDSRQEGIKRLINTLRSATIVVQVLPFVLSSLFILDFLAYAILPDDALFLIDSAFYVSPVVIVALLVLSRTLHLCKWHKIACLIPLTPDIMNIIDLVTPLTMFEAYAFNCSIVLMVALLLIAAYKVFLK